MGVLTRCEIANDNTDDSMTVDIESVGVTDKVQTDDNILNQDTDIPSAHTDVIDKGMESVGVKDNVYTDNTQVTDKVYTDDTPDHNDDSTMIPSNHTDVNNEVMESVQNADQATGAVESAVHATCKDLMEGQNPSGVPKLDGSGKKLLSMHLVQMEGRNPSGVLTRCEIAKRRVTGNLLSMQTAKRRDSAITDREEGMTTRPNWKRRRSSRRGDPDRGDSIKRSRPNIHVNDNDAQTGTSRAKENEASFNSNVKEIPKQKTTTLLDIQT